MKTPNLKKMCITPLLLMGIFLVFLSSCEKDKDGAADSLSVKVNFTGNVKPNPGNILMVVVYNKDVTELDIETEMVVHFFIRPTVARLQHLQADELIDRGVGPGGLV